jgi:hypothetical protein
MRLDFHQAQPRFVPEHVIDKPCDTAIAAMYRANPGRRAIPPIIITAVQAIYQSGVHLERRGGGSWAFNSDFWHCEITTNKDRTRAHFRAWILDPRGKPAPGPASVDRRFVMRREADA